MPIGKPADRLYYGNVIREQPMFINELELSRINNINDFMIAVGHALSEGNGDMLMALQDISQGWMQTSEEMKAQQALLTGALDAIGW